MQALTVFRGFKDQYPPYGLVDTEGAPITTLPEARNPWLALTFALRSTARTAVERAMPTTNACPYHEAVARRIGSAVTPLKPFDDNEHGLDTLRQAVRLGAELNAPLFTSLIQRIPALQRLHGNTADVEPFARNSVVLLDQPLQHPQQLARAFVYSLGALDELFTSNFLNDDIARAYTKVETMHGADRLNWATPTATFDLELRMPVDVLDRIHGSELEPNDAHTTIYPIGTRLGDIAVTEPTIGCPGNLLAHAVWQQAIDVVVGEGMWSQGVPN